MWLIVDHTTFMMPRRPMPVSALALPHRPQLRGYRATQHPRLPLLVTLGSNGYPYWLPVTGTLLSDVAGLRLACMSTRGLLAWRRVWRVPVTGCGYR